MMINQQLYLNGQWRDGRDSVEVTDPGNGETIGRMATVGRDEAWQAIDDAHAAFPGWRSTTARTRGDHLLAAADAMQNKAEQIARIITRENGKPIRESRMEVAGSIDHLRWFAEEGRRAYGRIVPPQAEGKRHLVLRQPIGVTAAVAPWNFPLILSVRKVAPALVAGCPVILKPAGATPLCAGALAQCLDETGIPPGVFQLIAGPASRIAEAFMQHPHCRKLTFTGSTGVGQKLIAQSADQVTRLSLELGGQAPLLIFDDADLESAVDDAMITKFRNAGQSCIASNRFYVQNNIFDAFVERFTEKVKALKTGYGLDESVDVGAMIDESSLNSALKHIREAVERGARITTGGERADIEAGCFLQPTVLVDVPDDALCMCEETFASVAPIVRFSDEAEAIARANDTRYGLAAYAYTSNLSRAFRVAEQLEAGSVCINDAVPSTSNCPFGGMKQSGIGRELGSEGLDAFLETKHVSLGGID